MRHNTHHPVERRRAIHKEILIRRSVSVRELCRQFQASAATIRRDLDALERDNLLQRTFGGAAATVKLPAEADFAVREMQDVEAKKAMACAAMEMIHPGDTLFLAEGTTILELARRLAASDLKICAITAALNIANVLRENPAITVYVLGGLLGDASHATSGPLAQSLLERFTADTLFMSANALDIDHGLAYADAANGALVGKMIERARCVVALQAGGKFGERALLTVAGLDEIATLITEKIDRPRRETLARRYPNLNVIEAGKTGETENQ